jgi:hypothetical protein
VLSSAFCAEASGERLAGFFVARHSERFAQAARPRARLESGLANAPRADLQSQRRPEGDAVSAADALQDGSFAVREKAKLRRVLGRFDLVLFTACAIIGLDSVA